MVTRQKVASVLRRAGFAASKSHATAVKGYRTIDTGYTVEVNSYSGQVSVKHRFAHFTRACNDQPFLERYAAALNAAGIATTLEPDRVTINKEEV